MSATTALTTRFGEAAAPLRAALGRVSSWMLDGPRATTSVALLRAVVGVCGVAFYLSDYRLRHLLFGPGVLETPQMADQRLTLSGSASLYQAVSGATGFDVLFHLGLGLAVLVAIGVGGRLVLALHYVFIWSLYATNPLLLDGGDNIIMIVGLLLLLTRCHDRLAVSLLWRRPRPPWRATVLLHNTALLMMAGQICVVYLMAGLYKVQGRLWQDGTALYYVLRVPEFTWPGVTEHLFRFDWLLVVGAYATVWISIYFPLLVLVRRTRLLAVLLMTGFHVSIALLMGLTSFAAIMVACDLLFVNRHVERGLDAVGSAGRAAARPALRVLSRVPRPHHLRPATPPSPARRTVTEGAARATLPQA